MMAFLKTTTEKCPKHDSYLNVQCAICFSILIEPVTLPCNHELCMPCFKETLKKSNLWCPFCRKRMSSWARKASRQNRLVNEKRWTYIKSFFPEMVERRLRGLDVLKLSSCDQGDRILCKPGEIRQEYEEQMRMLSDERKKMEEVNEKRFWNYMKDDCDKKEVTSDNFHEATTSKEINRQIIPQEITIIKQPVKDCNRTNSDISDELLFLPEVDFVRSNSHLSSHSSKTRSESSASNDSISQELCHFKPIKIAPKTPPKPQPDGRLVEPPLVLTTPRNLRNFSQIPSSMETCVPLRRKLSTICTDRDSKRLRRESVDPNNEDKVKLENEKPVPLNQFPNKKSILPLEPNIPIADQTSSYSFYSATSFITTQQYEEEEEDGGSKSENGGSKSENQDEKVAGQGLSVDGKGDVEDLSLGCCSVKSGKKGNDYSHVNKESKKCEKTVVQIVEQQMALMNTLKQEESDWKLAQKLQRTFDLEWKRCRGVREPYQLRKRHITAVPVVNGGQRRKHV